MAGIELDELQQEIEEEQGFTIDTDEKAEWALKKVREREEEYHRIERLGLSDIERVSKIIEEEKVKCDRDTGFLRAKLDDYMNAVPCKTTKTGQMKYKLLTGTLVRKPGTIAYKRDDDRLAEWLLHGGRTDLLKTKVTPMWAELKKEVIVKDGLVLDKGSGEIVEGVTAEMQAPSFEIKWAE